MSSQKAEIQARPAFWKRWLVSMISVYPPLVVLVFAFRALFQDMPTLLSLFLIAGCLTGMTTGFILPFLNRRLISWLNA